MVTYEIVKHISVLSEHADESKELNLISYNKRPPKYDLRTWKHEGDELRMLKGITLTSAEARALRDALSALSLDEENT